MGYEEFLDAGLNVHRLLAEQTDSSQLATQLQGVFRRETIGGVIKDTPSGRFGFGHLSGHFVEHHGGVTALINVRRSMQADIKKPFEVPAINSVKRTRFGIGVDFRNMMVFEEPQGPRRDPTDMTRLPYNGSTIGLSKSIYKTRGTSGIKIKRWRQLHEKHRPFFPELRDPGEHVAKMLTMFL